MYHNDEANVGNLYQSGDVKWTNIRLAEIKDIDQLVTMSWDKTIEFDVSKSSENYNKFAKECYRFSKIFIIGGRYAVFVQKLPIWEHFLK